MSLQRTFGLVKTGAMKRGVAEHIVDAAAAAGLHTVVRRLYGTDVFRADATLFEALYAEHAGRPYYTGLLASVSRQSLAFVLEGDDAVAKWRSLMGPTDPVCARAEAPQALRALYGGEEMPDNATHGSATEAEAVREILLFYPRYVP